jgi:hypothetical protein
MSAFHFPRKEKKNRGAPRREKFSVLFGYGSHGTFLNNLVEFEVKVGTILKALVLYIVASCFVSNNEATVVVE